MTRLLVALVLTASFLLPIVSSAADEADISKVMTDYWAAYAKADYGAAAKLILPEDLALAQKEMPPVFIEAARSSSSEAKEMATAFFGPIPPDQRASLTGIQTYECLNRFIGVAMPGLQETLKASTITVDKVEIKAAEATAFYKVSIQGETSESTEAFIKKDGKWWLRVKEDSKETARKFRALLAQ